MKLEAQALLVRLRAREVIAGMDFSARGGEVTALIGPNGAGKTTLLRALAGLIAPAAGRVLLDDRPLAEWPSRQVARSLAYYKVPTHVEIRSEPLPRNATGKVLKAVLTGEAENTFRKE